MVSVDRWNSAQQYERGFWEGVAEKVRAGAMPEFDWYQWRSDQLRRRLERLGLKHLIHGGARVVEIGSGPIGLINNFPAEERIAVDPLSDYYSSDPALARVRDPSVEHRQGIGEELPCESGRYDLVIIENCIDHVRDMDAVMDEIRRVLTGDGVLYMTVNSRTPWWGYYMHRVLSILKLDPGHPHTFTPRRAGRLVERHGFDPVDIAVGSPWRAHWEDLRAAGIRAKAKAALGVSEYLVSLIALRKSVGR